MPRQTERGLNLLSAVLGKETSGAAAQLTRMRRMVGAVSLRALRASERFMALPIWIRRGLPI